jgi:inward rectifier potassium channel
VSDKTTTVTTPGGEYSIRVVGIQKTPLRDFYHFILRISWAVTFGLLAVGYLVANLVFAVAYAVVGGVGAAASFADDFFFSVQTMGTIGYGGLVPTSTAANLLVVGESITGLILTALATGIVFAKFSRPTARMVFSRDVTISPMNGVPTLSFRMGNARSNQIMDAQIRLVLSRTEITTEGKMMYRIYDLALVRDRALSLSRSFTVMHTIDDKSPLFGVSYETLEKQEAELAVLVVGLDDTMMHSVHAYHQWYIANIKFGMRHADVLSEPTPNQLLLDLTKFHDLEPA